MIELNDTTMSTITNKLNSSTSVFKSKTKNGKISNRSHEKKERKKIKIMFLLFYLFFFE